MDVLSGAIPTFRSVRAAFAAGALWLVALVIALQPRVGHASRPLRLIWGAVRSFGNVATPVLPLIGILVAAYLLGIISEALLGALTRYFTVKIVAAHRFLASVTPGFTASECWNGQRKVATISDWRETALGPAYADWSPENREGVRRHVRESKQLVHRQDNALEAAVEEAFGDAEYRLQLVAPTLALGVACASYLPVPWNILAILLSGFAVLAISASANFHAESANEALAEWRAANPPPEVSSPTAGAAQS